MSDTPTVLLVEDDPIILDATSETLIGAGCEVRSAVSCEEALGALDVCPPKSVLVTDIVLVGPPSGLDLIQ